MGLSSTGLSATISGSEVTLNWNAATDGQTPAAGLTYNIRVGSYPGGSDIVGQNSLPRNFAAPESI